MRLASPEQVVATASIPSNDGSLARAALALNGSFYLLESILETKLVQTNMLDSFSLSRSQEAPYILRLTNRFIQPATVLVYAKAAGTPLSGLTLDTQLDVDSYSLDPVRGTVTIHGPLPFYGSNCVSVMYTSGFPINVDDAELLVAPEDIQGFAISAAILELNTVPSSVANRKDKANASVTKAMYGYLAKACEAYSRPRMTVEYPNATIVYG